MKNICCTLIFVLMSTSFIYAQQQKPVDILHDEKYRDAIFDAIIGEHDLMKAFLEKAKDNELAKMMVSHIMGEGSVMSSADHHMMMGDHPADTAKSPYVGEEARAIKSLSPDDIEKYRNGEGMGMAKAAELNHYPGPRHVLQVASELNLSNDQKIKTQKAFDAMHKDAVRLGTKIVEGEKQLNALFAGGTIDKGSLAKAVTELGRLQGEFRLTHLGAHLTMKKLLTGEQVSRYDSLRGYLHGGTGQQH